MADASTKLTGRDRFLKALRHEEPDRVPIYDSLWTETTWNWQKQGLPNEVPVDDYFNYEMAGFGFDESPMFEIKTLQKDSNYIVESTAFGGVRKNLRTYSSTPEILDWPIKSKADWERIRPRLQQEFAPDYVRADWVAVRAGYQTARSEGKCVAFCAAIGYDMLQSYMKSDDLLLVTAEDPAWFREMVGTIADLVLRLAKMMIGAGYKPDIAFLFNDMAYRNGPLFSPKTYRECIMEWDKMLCDYFHSQGMYVLYHTDGDIHKLIPPLIEAGVDCLQPLEAKANMDVRELKKEYGDRMAFMGNIDARKMSHPDPKVIEEEIRSKFEAAMPGGGYIYHSDHSIPPDVTFEQYCRVMELVRKYGQY